MRRALLSLCALLLVVAACPAALFRCGGTGTLEHLICVERCTVLFHRSLPMSRLAGPSLSSSSVPGTYSVAHSS